MEDSSLNQSEFPFSKAGFFNTLLEVLMTRSAFDGPLFVDREECCMYLFSRSSEK